MHIQDIQVAGVNVDSMIWGIATDRTQSTTRRSNREREGSNNNDDEYSVWIMWNMKLYQVSMIINIQYYNDIWLHFGIVPICSVFIHFDPTVDSSHHYFLSLFFGTSPGFEMLKHHLKHPQTLARSADTFACCSEFGQECCDNTGPLVINAWGEQS